LPVFTGLKIFRPVDEPEQRGPQAAHAAHTARSRAKGSGSRDTRRRVPRLPYQLLS
jgi:hypothetical protein